MVMPSSGPLNMGGTTSPRSVAAELGLSLTATISMNQANVRTLAGVGGSGTQWSMSSLYGKSNTYTIEFLVVAGGGGGERCGGGAGGGGAISGSGYAVSPGTAYSITVGGGGSGAAGGGSTNGSNSSAFGQTPSGGGRAGSIYNAASSGGSGGGAGDFSPNRNGGSGTAGQGGSGGNLTPTCAYAFAGGGGAGPANGGTPISPPLCTSGPTDYQRNVQGGTGGAGRATVLRGSTEYFGGGGGGGVFWTCIFAHKRGLGGIGGGGNGGGNSRFYCPCLGTYIGPCTPVPPTAGGTNTGGGAGSGNGGVGSPNFVNGGSGIVILRYPGSQRGSGGTVTSAAGYTIHTFTSSGTYTA